MPCGPPQVIGRFVAVLPPSPLGPRNCGQSAACIRADCSIPSQAVTATTKASRCNAMLMVAVYSRSVLRFCGRCLRCIGRSSCRIRGCARRAKETAADRIAIVRPATAPDDLDRPRRGAIENHIEFLAGKQLLGVDDAQA